MCPKKLVHGVPQGLNGFHGVFEWFECVWRGFMGWGGVSKGCRRVSNKSLSPDLDLVSVIRATRVIGR